MQELIKNSQEKNFQLPAVTLPKGGGAISGIGEKFSVNAVTGTGSMNVPIYLSQSRGGFMPSLSLRYDSGNGNSACGYGWAIATDGISRKTSKGIPQYNDETDVFLLSGAEDLVPGPAGTGSSTKGDETGYRIINYRPRTEGLFSRIEKWTSKITGDVHWKTVSKDNITSLYGLSGEARVYDPENQQCVFQWMIEKSYDARGNFICYTYKRENTDGIDASLSYEGMRLKDQKAFNHLYLKSVRYGNKLPGNEDTYHFHLVLDYGEHDTDNPSAGEQQIWTVRKDPFSRYNSGFEIRQYRLCRRILLFHEFDELGEAPVLVRSMALRYNETEKATTLISVQQSGHKIAGDGMPETKSFPPLAFNYSQSVIGTDIKSIATEYPEDLPYGVDGRNYQWLDLYGEGLPGIFTEEANGWFYRKNLGEAGFASPQMVAEKPHPSLVNGTQPVFSDVDADGSIELLFNGPVLKGYAAQNEKGWQPFIPFESYPVMDANDPDLKYIDLTGDGFADILISEDEVFTWYPSRGKKGYGPSESVRKALEEENGPALVFSNPEQSIYLAAMAGGGLNDIVRIRNGEIAYWPNLGYGKFGAKIIMENAPVLDAPDQFNQRRIRLFDVDGTGTTDLIYFAGETVRIYYNCSGNSWSEGAEIDSFPRIDDLSTLAVADLLGKGTGCLVWSSLLPADRLSPVCYIDLMSEGKPYLMTSVNNNMGKETLLEYAPSTGFYLDDLLNGTPWITKLNFPVHVLKKVAVMDHISSAQLVTSYKYHHGYYDGEEREFRGFGMIEQTDSESFDTYKPVNELDMPPVYTKTWFHTGAYMQQGVISQQYSGEYYRGDALAHAFPDSIIENAAQLDYDHLREAYRALKGKILRQEVYALDGTGEESIPYTVTETNFRIRLLQARSDQNPAVYLVLGNESLVYSYERNHADPRIAHTVLLETDNYGQPLKTVQVAYPRRNTVVGSYPEQQKMYVTAQVSTFLNETADFYLLGVPVEQKSYEINGLVLAAGACFFFDDLRAQLSPVFDEAAVLLHHEPFTGGVQARLLAWNKNYFWKDDMTALPFGEVSALALPHHSERIIISAGRIPEVYGTRVNDAMMDEAGYANHDDHWWNPGTTVYYLGEARFYLPFKTVDVFGNQSQVYYDGYSLAAIRSEDAVGNTVTAGVDYRTLAIKKITDINENISEALTDPLGMVIATTAYGTVDGVTKGDSPVSGYREQAGFTLDDVVTNPAAFLQEATSFFYYNLEAWANSRQPPHFINLLRETHVSELNGAASAIQIHLGYSDGFGRKLQQKLKVDNDTNGNERWLVTGRTVYNNKEKPVKQYEPFYSGTHAYQDEEAVAQVGVTPVIYYDPLGRAYKTDTPKGFYSKVEFDPWQVSTYDENDTVKDSVYYVVHSSGGDEEAAALEKAAAHYNTPAVAILDTLSRQFITMQYYEEGGSPLITFTEFDVQGHPVTVTDPRQYAANQTRASAGQVHNFTYLYDLAGNKLYTNSTDAGESWSLTNAAGKAIHTWNGRGYHSRIDYDALQRPLQESVDGNGLNQVVQLMNYGENEPDAISKNFRGQLIRHYDQAGLVENSLFDFKGQLLRSGRTLRTEYKTEVSWNDPAAVSLENEKFGTELAYDALGRIVTSVQPDGSISRPAYHQPGWLKKVEVQLKGEAGYTTFVESIEYNVKGQRTKIVYGNGVNTNYAYEATTFRLTGLITTRQEANGGLTLLQDISYVYDPVGNIVAITDSSFEKVFVANQLVEPKSTFVYDALYQLIEATGREHLGLTQTDYRQRSDVYKSILFASINDGNQLRNYTEKYTYDGSSNLIQIRHIGENSFTRDLTVSDVSNRAITDEMDHTAEVESYFDAAGNMKQLEHIEGIDWNYRNNIASVTIIRRGTESDMEYYVYDASGQRIRKVKLTYNGTGDPLWIDEKIYLGAVEIRRKYQGPDDLLREDRSALHVADNKNRIAIVYYWNASSDTSITIHENKTHYQFSNHLGSTSLELDDSGQMISYEEYFPFGGTSFTAGNSSIEVSLKEYRYSGKERDDTTGLYYYGARYYASWMGRWMNPDPLGKLRSMNVFNFLDNNPINDVDIGGKVSLKTIGIFAAVLAVGIAVTVLTAGIGTAALGGGVAAVLAGTAEVTLAQTILIGAVSGATGAVAAELTRQKLSGDLDKDGTINWRKVGISGVTGAIGGAVGGGVAASMARSTAQTTAAITATGLSKPLTTAAVSGGAGGVAGETSRQWLEGEDIDPYAIAEAGLVSAAVSVGSTKVIEYSTNKVLPPETASQDSPTLKQNETKDPDLEQLNALSEQLEKSPASSGSRNQQKDVTRARKPTILDPTKQYYQIGEGVRRSKAQTSKGTITARNMETGDIFEVPIDQLLVTPDKGMIDYDPRFERIVKGVQTGDSIPPIEVWPVTQAQATERALIPARDVKFSRNRR